MRVKGLFSKATPLLPYTFAQSIQRNGFVFTCAVHRHVEIYLCLPELCPRTSQMDLVVAELIATKPFQLIRLTPRFRLHHLIREEPVTDTQ